MSTKTRRSFLTDAALGVSAAVIANRSRSFAAVRSEHVRIGVIGCGNQGGNHIRSLSDSERRGNRVRCRHRSSSVWHRL